MVNINENTILCDCAIITDRRILANRPDIVIHDRKSKSCMLINVSVPEDKNIALKEAEKLAITKIWRSGNYPDVKCENQGLPGSRMNTRNVEKRLRERIGVDTRTS